MSPDFCFKSVSTYVTGTETFVFADLFVGTVTFFTDVTLTKTIVTVVVTFVITGYYDTSPKYT